MLVSTGLCDDDDNAAADHYALVEVWRGVCQVLRAETMILDLWRSWSGEQEHVYFEVKRLKHPRLSHTGVRGEKSVENRLEKMRAELRSGQVNDEKKQKTRRLSRRNSSVNRPRRAPDTVHPVMRRREEVVTNIETSVKDLVRRSEQLKLEIGRLESLETSEQEISRAKTENHDNHDTSDSGIVTDDSETVRVNTRKSYYEEVWATSDDVDTLLEETEKLNLINSRLENSEEQIIALNFEFRMLENVPGDAHVLENFVGEVSQLRSTNADLLHEISENRDSIERVSDDKMRADKVVKQLEFDLNMIEKEGLRLQRSLTQLKQVQLPEIGHDPQVTSLQTICDNNITKRSQHQLPTTTQLLMSPSTLV